MSSSAYNAPTGHHEAPARPKVMRRPSSFASVGAAPNPLPDPASPSELPSTPADRLSTARNERLLPAVAAPLPMAGWQEDVQFGAMLLLLIVLTNLGLIFWLPYLHRLETSPIPASVNPVATPATPVSAKPVSLYKKPAAQPAEAEDTQPLLPAPEWATQIEETDDSPTPQEVDVIPHPDIHILGESARRTGRGN